MTMPRQMLPHTTYLITRRCTQRMFLLKPTAQTTEIFAYCLAVAAARTGVFLHAVCVTSNHYHAVVTDPEARLPEFLHYLHEYVAKCINASLGRWENLWATEPPSAVRLEMPDDVLDKMVYVLTNPVKAFLVKKSRRWPGLLGFRRSDSHSVARPKVFFRPTGSTPETAKLAFVPPPAWAHVAPNAFERNVEHAVATAEAQCRAEAAQQGLAFLGEHAVMRQKVTDSPLTIEPRRRLSPKVAAKDKWRRIEALKRLKEFLATYREAWERWRNGKRQVVFPAGTYALRVYAGVCCHPT